MRGRRGRRAEVIPHAEVGAEGSERVEGARPRREERVRVARDLHEDRGAGRSPRAHGGEVGALLVAAEDALDGGPRHRVGPRADGAREEPAEDRSRDAASKVLHGGRYTITTPVTDQRPSARVVERHVVHQPVDGHDGPRVALLKEVVHLDGDAALSIIRKRRAEDGPTRGALLLSHGFGQNRYAWHLPGRSFVNFLAGAGWDVFNLDLRGHGRSRALGSLPANELDGYIHHDLPAAIDAARLLSGHARAFFLGHSLGGLVGYAAASRLTDRVRGIVTIGAPYDFGRGNRVLLELARGLVLATGWAERSARIPMRFIQDWFVKQRALWDLPGVPLPVRAWHPRSIEPALLDDYLRLAFDRATLGELAHVTASGTAGRFSSSDGAIDYASEWESTDLPVLIIAGTRDLLSPAASVRPAYERSRARDRTYREVPLGHADLLLGREAPKHTWPIVEAWLSRRCG